MGANPSAATALLGAEERTGGRKKPALSCVLPFRLTLTEFLSRQPGAGSRLFRCGINTPVSLAGSYSRLGHRMAVRARGSRHRKLLRIGESRGSSSRTSIAATTRPRSPRSSPSILGRPRTRSGVPSETTHSSGGPDARNHLSRMARSSASPIWLASCSRGTKRDRSQIGRGGVGSDGSGTGVGGDGSGSGCGGGEGVGVGGDRSGVGSLMAAP